jgi:hypothetical protein
MKDFTPLLLDWFILVSSFPAKANQDTTALNNFILLLNKSVKTTPVVFN